MDPKKMQGSLLCKTGGTYSRWIESSMNLMRVLVAQLLTTTMVLAGLLMAFHYDWPDYVHTNYGVPMLWAIHTESRITGPTDVWSVNVTSVIADIAIWAVSSLALVTVIDALKRRRK